MTTGAGRGGVSRQPLQRARQGRARLAAQLRRVPHLRGALDLFSMSSLLPKDRLFSCLSTLSSASLRCGGRSHVRMMKALQMTCHLKVHVIPRHCCTAMTACMRGMAAHAGYACSMHACHCMSCRASHALCSGVLRACHTPPLLHLTFFRSAKQLRVVLGVEAHIIQWHP